MCMVRGDMIGVKDSEKGGAYVSIMQRHVHRSPPGRGRDRAIGPDPQGPARARLGVDAGGRVSLPA